MSSKPPVYIEIQTKSEAEKFFTRDLSAFFLSFQNQKSVALEKFQNSSRKWSEAMINTGMIIASSALDLRHGATPEAAAALSAAADMEAATEEIREIRKKIESFLQGSV